MRIKIADFVFEIDNNYSYSEQFVTDYLTDEPFDFHIKIDEALLEEKQRLTPEYPASYLEFIEIYRKICDYILAHDGFLMHGAVIEYDACAYMFTAPSGTGKTTHIRQWKKLYGDKVSVINGDKPIIRYINGEFIAYGTPWCGKEHFNENKKAPLKGIVLLSRGAENSIESISSDCFNTFLLKQVYLPKNTQGAIKALDFADKLFSSVPLYSLKCNISTEAAHVACEKIHHTTES